MQPTNICRRVLIVGGGDEQVARLFRTYNWIVTDNWNEADLFQFTGGADVDPALYGEQRHPATFPIPHRDHIDQGMFHLAQAQGIPMAGICRGAQFLCAMTGGKLWQDVDNHAGGLHTAWNPDAPDERYIVTSTHHQAMIPHPSGRAVLVARESTVMETATRTIRGVTCEGLPSTYILDQVEAAVFPQFRAVAFQPHPEYPNCPQKTRDLYFHLIETTCFGGKS